MAEMRKKIMRGLVAFIRQTQGGHVYWLIMTLVYVVMTVVLVAMAEEPFVYLTIFGLMVVACGIITGVKLHDHYRHADSD